ncbi:MAG: methyl-accepting chemotaxis protein, partial [Thermodesulfobacteriota bacterium]|nr:methyl-accepting chemotaxis protein [Thermodesulfobacteriota bacterium]
EHTATALGEIVQSISKVSDLVGEISASSDEQAQGISQISIGLSQIDEVTQQNTSNAIQSAATSEELAAQAAEMREMMDGFTLYRSNMRSSALPTPTSAPTYSSAPAPVAPVGATNDAWGGGTSQPKISLDDDEFGKF